MAPKDFETRFRLEHNDEEPTHVGGIDARFDRSELGVREQMAAACFETVHDFGTTCGGSIPAPSVVTTDDLEQAMIGCCQKCGCLGATAEVIDGRIVARCNDDPSYVYLGDRLSVEQS